MNHTPFIIAAYAVFFVVFLIDALIPVFTRRRVLAQLAARQARERRRAAGVPESNEVVE
jgi:heme exporter protein CcmD